MVSVCTTYCIAGNFGGVKFWRFTNFLVVGRFKFGELVGMCHWACT